jgi:hypothetical protein
MSLEQRAGREGSSDEQLMSAAKTLAQYLSILLAIEYDIDAIDRIAKARRLEDFVEGIYNALRCRENLKQKIEEKIEKTENKESKEVLGKALQLVERFNAFEVDTLINLLRYENGSRLKLIASYIGTRALAFTEIEHKIREIFRPSQEG